MWPRQLTQKFWQKNNMKNIILLTLISSFAVAAEHGGAEHGIDTQTLKTIIYQAVNIIIIFAGLIYFMKKPLSDFFKNKRKVYMYEAEKAAVAKHAAEAEQSKLKEKLSRLENTAAESASRARAEAADMKNAMIKEAQSLSEKIKNEASGAAKLEIEKAKSQLKEQMIKEAMELSRSQLAQKVSREDHLRLQGEFLSNIQAVEK